MGQGHSAARTRTRLISVGGGKGGVGKSIVACNLAVAMAQLGKRTVLADLDLGAANQHLLLGIDRPRPGLETLLSRTNDDAREGLTATKIPNLNLLAGTGARLGAANITYGEKLRLLKRLRTLDADVVIIDVGAGVGYNALDFFELGAQRLVVTTPQVTAIHDAYSFLKSAVLRTLQHHADRSEADALAPATASSEGEKVVDSLARLRETDPAFAARVFHILAHFGAHLIGNQVVDAGQAAVFAAVSKMMQDYLGLTVPILGWLRQSPKVAESVNTRVPLLTSGGDQARTLRGMAEALLVEEVCAEEELLIEEDLGEATVAGPQLAPDALGVSPTRPTPPPPRAEAAPPPASKVRVYQPPPRKRKPDADKRRVSSAQVDDGRRRRRPSLPGLTPHARGR